MISTSCKTVPVRPYSRNDFCGMGIYYEVAFKIITNKRVKRMEKKAFQITLKSLLISMVILTAAMTSCDDDENQTNNSPYSLSGNASSGQVVPSVTGTGTGTISGTYNPSTRELQYSSNWNGLTGAPLSGGFYSGASGSAGTAVGTPWTFASGSTGTGSTSGKMTLTEEQAQQLMNGNWYYSYGTSANPNGEVRGQISTSR